MDDLLSEAEQVHIRRKEASDMLQVIKNIFSNFSIFLFYHYAYVPMGFCFVQGELISHRDFIQGNLYPRRYFINKEAKPELFIER